MNSTANPVQGGRRPSVTLQSFEDEEAANMHSLQAFDQDPLPAGDDSAASDDAEEAGFVRPESLKVDDGCEDPDEVTTALWESRRKEESDAGLQELEDKERMHIIQLHEMTSLHMLSPEASFRSKWDLSQVLILSYISAAVPFRLGFSSPVVLWSAVFWLDLSIDIYFIFDLFMNFRTAVRTGDGELIFHPGHVAKIYGSTWFPIDFLSCLPLNYIEYATAGSGADPEAMNKLAKLARLGRAARLLKILRLVRFKKLIDKYEEELYSVGAFRLLKLLMGILILSHWLACAWYFFGTFYAPDYIHYRKMGKDPPPSGTPGWVENIFGHADYGSTESTGGLTERYVASVYYAFMTLTTVGYGDIVPTNVAERVYACVAMLLGGFMFGMIVGSLGEIIRKSNPGDSARTKKMGLIHAFLHDTKVPRTLSLQIRSFYRGMYQEGTAIPTSMVFPDLPMRERKALATALDFIPGTTATRQGMTRTLGLVHRVPFFTSLEWWDVVKVCMKLKPLSHRQAPLGNDGFPTDENDWIMQQGVIEYEMYVVVDGVCLLTQDGKELGRVRKYDFFGELAVLLGPEMMARGQGCPKRTRGAYAFTKCDLSFINVDDMLELKRNSPSINYTVGHYAANVMARQPSALSRSHEQIETEAVEEAGSLFEYIEEKSLAAGGSTVGKLNLNELSKLLKFQNANPRNNTAEEVMKSVGVEITGMVTKESFLQWWQEERNTDAAADLLK